MKKIAILICATIITMSCSNSETSETKEVEYNHESDTEVLEEAEAPVEAEEAEMAVVILESNDQMKYNLAEIRVKSGQKVKLTLQHVGKLPKASMGHNFVLLKDGTEIAAFAGEAGQARENDYIAMESAIIAHTKLIGGGESDTIEFDAPALGVYDFICSFPGHYALMKGKFIVE